MAEVTQRIMWDHTSNLKWAIFRAAGGKSTSPDDYHPMGKRK